jgi:hypothetical protein
LRSPKIRKLIVGAALAAAVALASLYLTRHLVLRSLAESLVCTPATGTADLIFLDLVEHNYLLFERARQLQRNGLASRVLVPVLSAEADGSPNAVSLGFIEVMASISRLEDWHVLLAPMTEPISLNLALATRDRLKTDRVRSVLLVTEGFRSRRAFEIYGQVLEPEGIAVYCQPVFGSRKPDTWQASWHGIQEIGLQFTKLWFYRLHVRH